MTREYWLDPPEPKESLIKCGHCTDTLYVGQTAYEFDGQVFCSLECLSEHVDCMVSEIIVGDGREDE